MTNREAQMLKDAIDMALICLSHALEEPSLVDTYINLAMDELDVCAKYVEKRQLRFIHEITNDETD